MDVQPAIRTTPRFVKAFEDANVLLKKKVYSEVHQFVEYFRADPVTTASHYKTFSGVEPYTVLEFRLDYKLRALGHWDKQVLTLVDMGNHDHVYDPFCTEVLESQLPKAAKADREYWPDTSNVIGLFGSTPERQYERFENEDTPEWVYFLTSQQNGYVKSIVRGIKKGSTANPAFYFIVGGPGTGKTSILARLQIDLMEAGRKPGMIVTDRVAQYIESGGELNLSSYRLNKWDLYSEQKSPFDVVLFDDPDNDEEILSAFEKAKGRFRAVVVAFDPCQLGQDFDDEEYASLVEVLEARPYHLTACYRQKEVVGLAAKRVMDTVAESTPFLAQEKIAAFKDGHDRVYSLANTMSYPNRYGHEETHVDATVDDFRKEVRRIKRRQLWKHSPPVLLVVQKGLSSDAWNWQEELKGIPFVQLEIQSGGYGRLQEVKGIEFQHSFFVISSSLFNELNEGFEGSGQKLFHQRRLLRIPFSRAKDSIVTFVM
jgi:hypothetical protein